MTETVLQKRWRANEDAEDHKASLLISWKLSDWTVIQRLHDGERYWYEIHSHIRGETRQLRHYELLELADTAWKTGLTLGPTS